MLKIEFNTVSISNLYVDQPSYYAGETANIYFSTNDYFPFNKTIFIDDIIGNHVDSFQATVEKQSTLTKNVLRDGLGYKNVYKYKIASDMRPGIYLINNLIPLIIKSKKKAEVTVVYPYANNTLYQEYENQTVFSLELEKSSLLRQVPIGRYSDGLRGLFNYLDKNYQVNYITDLDLEDSTNIEQTDLLIIYGKSPFWTPRMRSSFQSYLNKGGDVLLMSSYVLNNVFWYNKDDYELTLRESESIAMKSWKSYDNSPPEDLIGLAYEYGGYITDELENYYKVIRKEHPILKGINDSLIFIKGDLFQGVSILKERALNDSLNFFRFETLAYTNSHYQNNLNNLVGIFILQPKSTSGKILSLGTEDWCLKDNYEGNEQLQTITKNAVNYLLKN